MNLDWILQPLTLYAVAGMALMASAAIFVSTKRDIWRLRQAARQSSESLTQQMEQMQSAIAEMSKPAAAAEGPALVAVASMRPSVNLTRRAQALRMRRRGESVESIAAALTAPRNEIELLLKIHDMLDVRKN